MSLVNQNTASFVFTPVPISPLQQVSTLSTG